MDKTAESSDSKQILTPANGAPTTSQQFAENSATRSESEDEDGNEILEESPCGRWQKRREQVKQRDVPGIDVAYLAMDNEEGVEVVWNEVQFSERKNFRAQEFSLCSLNSQLVMESGFLQEKIKAVFDNLTQLHHANLVKFHNYWTDTKSEKPRVIFITEYMSSGSITQFLKRTRQGNKNLSEKAWKKWCTQILSALSYLHSCDPPIIHGNLSCNTIFIQHNGLIKIGCVAPDAIHHHVKTFRENMKNMHYIAPEYEFGTMVTPAVDVYSFGICALEMAALGFQTNGETATTVSQELIHKTIQSLDDTLQKDFIEKCLITDPKMRPTARELLFHPVLFEVHSLKVLAAHVVVSNKGFDTLSEDAMRMKDKDKERVLAEVIHRNGSPPACFKYSDVPALELDKFLEDVRNGIYPLIAYSSSGVVAGDGLAAQRADSPAEQKSSTPSQDTAAEDEPLPETRRIVTMQADVKPFDTPGGGLHLSLSLRLEDRMNRLLTCDITDNDTSEILAKELVNFGFINLEDYPRLAVLLEDVLMKHWASMSLPEPLPQV